MRISLNFLTLTVALGSSCLIPVNVGSHDAGSVCTPGRDDTCNEIASMSALAGACEATSTCACRSGFSLQPSGRCGAATDAGQGVCTPGQDQTCNEIVSMSAFAGTCQATSTCMCRSGFSLQPSGRCRAATDGGQGVCTPGQDQTCNEDASMSALAGVCLANSTCACGAGFSLMASGRCGATDAGQWACTVGQDQTCNANATMSALAGRCLAGACNCNTGFELDSTGRCAVGGLTVSPTVLDFGAVAVGATARLTVTFRNTSPSAVTVSGISTSSPFAAPTTPLSVSAGTSATLEVTWRPIQVGAAASALVFTAPGVTSVSLRGLATVRCTQPGDVASCSDLSSASAKGVCAASGACICRPGYVLNTAGICAAPSTCTIGVDACNDDLQMSALAGRCAPIGSGTGCECNNGWDTNPTTGKCRGSGVAGGVVTYAIAPLATGLVRFLITRDDPVGDCAFITLAAPLSGTPRPELSAIQLQAPTGWAVESVRYALASCATVLANASAARFDATWAGGSIVFMGATGLNLPTSLHVDVDAFFVPGAANDPPASMRFLAHALR